MSTRQVMKAVGKGIAWLLLAVVVIALAAAVYVQTDAGKARLARILEDRVSRAIPGRMEIGQIERVGWASVLASELRFRHPAGNVVLHVEKAAVDLDLGQLARGRLGFRRASVEGGRLLLDVQPDGRLGIEAAFDRPGPARNRDDEGFQYRLRSMHVQGLTLEFRPSPDESFVLHDVEGFVAIERVVTQGVQIVLERISGRLERELLVDEIQLVQADGWVHGGARQILALDVQARLGDGEFAANIEYFDREREPVKVTLSPGDDIEVEATALAAALASWFSDDVDIALD